MTFADIIALVEEKCDGRSLGSARHIRWANLVRNEVARNILAGGFHGLYFLYKEATVSGGSVAGQARYQLPDDFIDDLSVWFDGELMLKSDGPAMDITVGSDAAANTNGDAPIWVARRGREFEFLPTPPEAGKEIKLFYNGLPDEIVAEGSTDFFLTQYPQLHVLGMAEHALDYVGNYNQARAFRQRFLEEVQRLMLDNRRFWLKGVKVRFQNWDEFVERRHLVFPQFGNLTITGD